MEHKKGGGSTKNTPNIQGPSKKDTSVKFLDLLFICSELVEH